jgi:hypothetical protein
MLRSQIDRKDQHGGGVGCVPVGNMSVGLSLDQEHEADHAIIWLHYQIARFWSSRKSSCW